MPSLQINTGQVNVNYTQAFPTGTSFTVEFNNNRQTTNSLFFNLSPALNSMYRFSFQQQLLAGFGFGPNLRYLAHRQEQQEDLRHRLQRSGDRDRHPDRQYLLGPGKRLRSRRGQRAVVGICAAVAGQCAETASAGQHSRHGRDARRSRSVKARSGPDRGKTNLQLQESLIKNALTKNLDDPVLESMPVIPTDRLELSKQPDKSSGQDLITQALQDRPELSESDIDLVNRQISRKAAKNALLPSLALVGFYGGTGLAGPESGLQSRFTDSQHLHCPTDFAGALANAFNNSSPDYYVGLNLNLPIRNRVAKADQYRSELEYRQAELRLSN